MSWDWRKILEVLILGQFVIEKVKFSFCPHVHDLKNANTKHPSQDGDWLGMKYSGIGYNVPSFHIPS